jgi:uncharacterized SAM-binding protein YcdF (DUF218 family)
MNLPTKPGSFVKPFAQALPRAAALFLGSFAFVNSIGDLLRPGFAADLWWIDLRFLPTWLARALLLPSAFFLVVFALRPHASHWRRALTACCSGVLGVVALANAAGYYALLLEGHLFSRWPVPLSLLVAGALASVCCAVLCSPSPEANSARLRPVLVLTFGCCALFPLLQMFCFGKTDYRRPADVTVVFGARAYADGHPSDALADRVRTACELYRQGLTRKLLMSGGPGDGATHETECMRRMAVSLGVRLADILLDRAGLNTEATVRNTRELLRQVDNPRVLVVSHFYHLPRIKLAFQRAGLEVYTVPARESYVLRQLPYNMAREVAALWVYYVKC